MSHSVQKTVIANGIRVITERLPHVPSVSLGVWIGAGSKHEPAGRGGISHFIEHMVFKGTERRSAFEIALALESVGGTLDAFTGRELTCFYARVLPEHQVLALDVLSDLLLRPRFDEEHLSLEKKVVIDEIRSFLDDPDDLVHELLAQAVWRDHPLGRNVLGTVDEVNGFARDDLFAYYRQTYRGGRIVVAAAGAVEHDAFVQEVASRFAFPSGGAVAAVNGDMAPPLPRVQQTREEGQEYVCLGGRAVSYRHEDRYPSLVLSTLLGGGMSSRLFQEVREERGLAYAVFTYLDCFAETGLWGTYVSLKPEWTEEAVEVILREFGALLRQGLRPGEMESAKAQLKGSTLLSLESTSNRMMRLARSEFYYGRLVDLAEVSAAIDAVTEEAVMRIAHQLLTPENLSLVLLGPLHREGVSIPSFNRQHPDNR